MINEYFKNLTSRSIAALVGVTLISSVSLAQAISPARQYAALLYQRLGGVTLPIDAPILATIESQIASGDYVGAANTVIASEPNFYNITVREFAAKMYSEADKIE